MAVEAMGPCARSQSRCEAEEAAIIEKPGEAPRVVARNPVRRDPGCERQDRPGVLRLQRAAVSGTPALAAA